MEQQNNNIQQSVNVDIPTTSPTKQNNTLVIILSVLLLISMSISGYFAYQTQTLVKELTTLKNTTEPTPTATSLPTETPLSTESVKLNNTDKDVIVISEINSLFKKINTKLETNVVTKEENYFYDIVGGEVNKTSWNLDLTDTIKGKEQMSLINAVLETNLKTDPDKSAGGVGSSVSGYMGENIYCYLLVNVNKKTVVTCSGKQ